MHKDIPVLEGKYSLSEHTWKDVKVINETHLPVGVCKEGKVSLHRLNRWNIWRGIPAYRVGLETLEKRLDISSPLDLLEQSHMVSVSDTYWMKEKDEDVSWKDVSFFSHDFDGDGFGRAMFGDYDYTVSDSAYHTPNNVTTGYHRKAWMWENNVLLLYKGGSPVKQLEPVNEWLASEIARRLRIYAVPYVTRVYLNNVVSVCRNFCDEDHDLVCGRDILQEYPAEAGESVPMHYVKVLRKHGIKGVKHFLSDQCLLDYVLMNTDRHGQNYGILVDANTNTWKETAPVFDTGTSLGCLLSEDQMEDAEKLLKANFFGERDVSYEKLVPWIRFDYYDLTALDGIVEAYTERLNRYREITNLSQYRIDSTAALLKTRIARLKAHAERGSL
jgi:hypothetical protein